MENHHFEWENSLCQWPFSIAILLVYQAGYDPRSQIPDPSEASESEPVSEASEAW